VFYLLVALYAVFLTFSESVLCFKFKHCSDFGYSGLTYDRDWVFICSVMAGNPLPCPATDILFTSHILNRVAAAAYSFQVRSSSRESATVHCNSFQNCLSSPPVPIKCNDCNNYNFAWLGIQRLPLYRTYFSKAVLISTQVSRCAVTLSSALHRAVPRLNSLKVESEEHVDLGC